MSVNALISAISALWLSIAPANNTICENTCVTSQVGVDLIAYFEGYSPVVYIDAAGYPTIGYGHKLTSGESFTILRPDQAMELLHKDVAKHAKPVNSAVQIPLHQNQFDALVSFTYNLGEGALRKSTLLKRVNAKRHADVPNEFRKWVYAGGVKLRGLIIRRNAEADLYIQTK